MKNFFLLLFISIAAIANGQTAKKIIISRMPKKVPAGKVWKLERGKETIVQVSDGTLNSGTLCNAMFLSRPRIVFNINKGDYYKAEGFAIIFEDLEKIPYTNDVTYSIKPVSMVDKNFSLSELSNTAPENVGVKEIVFKSGETVFIGECLVSIELTEYNMTQTELQLERKKSVEKEKAKNKLKSNFNIPVNPEKYVTPGTKPTLKDSLLNKIIFSSDGVMHRQPGKQAAFDNNTLWQMTLTTEDLKITGSGGIDKSYKLFDISYDDELRCQKFKLGDYNGNATHTLDISWSNSAKQYYFILSAIDRSEEYQFQNTQATLKE